MKKEKTNQINWETKVEMLEHKWAANKKAIQLSSPSVASLRCTAKFRTFVKII